MRKLIAITMLICFIVFGQLVWANFLTEKTPLNYDIKTLRSEPNNDSSIIYKFPIEVSLLDISEDGDWYKVSINYMIGPFIYTYVGWTHLPINTLKAKLEAEDNYAETPLE
ncbi:MAG: hypothetical protein ABIE84_04515 [bacterium]